MRGLNIGELFVSLGFDIKDESLKTFNNTISDTMSSMLKLAGVTATAGGSLFAMKGATDTAINLRNLSTELGLNERSVQSWAAAWKYSNPGQSLEQGAAALKNVSQYLNNVRWNGGSAAAFNLLGGKIDDSTTVEDINNQVRQGLPNLIATRGRPFAAQTVTEIYGTADAMNTLNLSLDKFQEEAAKGLVTEEQNANMVQMRSNLSDLGTQWDTFWGTLSGTIAPFITNILTEINSSPVTKKDGIFKGSLDYVGQHSWIDWVGEHSYLNPISDMFNWKKADEKATIKRQIQAKTGKNFTDITDADIDNYLASQKPSTAAPVYNASDSAGFWQSMGYNPSAIAGLLAQENAESGGNPLANNGSHFGLFQWNAARAARILLNTGIDVKSADRAAQLKAAAWELKNLGLDVSLSHVTSPRDASVLLSKKFEMHEAYTGHGDETDYRARMAEQIANGGISQTNHIVIHTTADGAGTVEAMKQETQNQLNTTYSQINTGAY